MTNDYLTKDAGAKQTDDAVIAPLLSTTIQLRRPLVDGEGNKISQLELVEPRQIDVQLAEKKHRASPGHQTAALLANLSGLPADSFMRLLPRDLKAIEVWLHDIVTDAVDADKAAGVLDDDDEGADEVTFELLVPIPSGKGFVTSVVVQAPDLEAQIVAQKFKGEAESWSALIAHLTGLKIPVVQKMTRRDLARIQAWIDPFLPDTDSMTEMAGG